MAKPRTWDPPDPDKLNLVIFCGAGFSAFAGMPVMTTFSDKLRASRILGDRQSAFDAIQLQCEALGAFIGGSSRNVEQLASFLSMLRLTKPDFHFEHTAYSTPDLALGLVIEGMRKLVCPPVKAAVVRDHTKGLFELCKRANVSFVTTNYDLLIESAAKGHQIACRPTDDVVQAFAVEDDWTSLYWAPEAMCVRIFKLHGSVNWFDDDFKLVVHNKVVVGEHPGSPAPEWKTELCEAANPAACLMVPPSVIKPNLFDRLASQWQGAARAMAEADQVWFIGYSFPETDSFMRYFLATALFSNVRLNQLAVIAPDLSVGRRAKAMFQMPSHREVFAHLPMRWEKVTLSRLLDRDPYYSVNADVRKEIEDVEAARRIVWGEGD